jgi:hypothetical protein
LKGGGKQPFSSIYQTVQCRWQQFVVWPGGMVVHHIFFGINRQRVQYVRFQIWYPTNWGPAD